MKRVLERGATLRLELFTSDPRASLDLGYVEGRNIAIEVRYADDIRLPGPAERFRYLAAELVGLAVDVILTSGTLGDARRDRGDEHHPDRHGDRWRRRRGRARGEPLPA